MRPDGLRPRSHSTGGAARRVGIPGQRIRQRRHVRWGSRVDLAYQPAFEHGASRHIGCHAVSMSSTLRHCVLGGLHWACPDDFPSRLRFEYRRFLCEGIDAFPRLGGGLLDDNEFGESGDEEGSRFLEFLVANFGERLDDALDVLARHIAWMLLSDFLNEFRLRHQLGHVTPCFRIALGGTTLTSNLQWRELGGWLPPTAASSRIRDTWLKF